MRFVSSLPRECRESASRANPDQGSRGSFYPIFNQPNIVDRNGCEVYLLKTMTWIADVDHVAEYQRRLVMSNIGASGLRVVQVGPRGMRSPLALVGALLVAVALSVSMQSGGWSSASGPTEAKCSSYSYNHSFPTCKTTSKRPSNPAYCNNKVPIKGYGSYRGYKMVCPW